MIDGVLYAHGLKNNFLFFIFKFIGIIAELLKTLIKNGMKSTSTGDTKKNRQRSKQTFALVLPSPHHKLLSLFSLHCLWVSSSVIKQPHVLWKE